MRVFIIFAILLAATPVYAQSMGTTSGAMAVINSSDPANTTNRVISAPTVAAPGLTAAGIETCLGSASGGLSAMGGGVTFGTTTVDEGCTIRLLARQLYAFGFQKAAVALMCQEQRVAIAMDDAGSPCPPSAEIRQSDRGAVMPALSFAQDEHALPRVQEELAQPLTQEEQAQPLAQETQNKPFTLEEQAMFARASNIN
jgi:hypothetical protein